MSAHCRHRAFRTYRRILKNGTYRGSRSQGEVVLRAEGGLNERESIGSQELKNCVGEYTHIILLTMASTSCAMKLGCMASS